MDSPSLQQLGGDYNFFHDGWWWRWWHCEQKAGVFQNSSTIFDLEDLLRAFAEVLGKGTFGTTYKAALEAGMMVAVKILKDVTVSLSQIGRAHV